MDYITILHEKLDSVANKAELGYDFINSLAATDENTPAERIHLDSCISTHRAYVELVTYSRLLKEFGDYPSDVTDKFTQIEEAAEQKIKRLEEIAELVVRNMRILELQAKIRGEYESDDSSATP